MASGGFLTVPLGDDKKNCLRPPEGVRSEPLSKKGEEIRVTFWGTRGSLPTPGRSTLRYGGNTSCVEIRNGNHRLILDAGTGIRPLGLSLIKKGGSRSIPIFITHTHMDHIGGLPFFPPALKKRTTLKIFGPRGLKGALSRLFPFSKLPSRRIVCEIGPTRLRVPSFQVSSFWTNHPGGALAYRIVSPRGKTIVYASDHEPVASFCHGKQGLTDGRFASFLNAPDLLIMDAQFLDGEYGACRGWGHSSVVQTVRLALRCRARHLVLFHHDPGHSDKILLKKLAKARKLIARSGKKLACSLAAEGRTFTLK